MSREEQIAKLQREIDELRAQMKPKTPEQLEAMATTAKQQRHEQLRARLRELRESPLGNHASNDERAERATEVERIFSELHGITSGGTSPEGYDAYTISRLMAPPPGGDAA